MLLASVADACNSYDIDSSSLLEVLQKDPFKQESVEPEDEPVEPAAKIAKRSQLSPLAQQMRQSLLIQLHGDVNQPSQARREPGGRAAKIPKGSVGRLMPVVEPGRYVFLPNMTHKGFLLGVRSCRSHPSLSQPYFEGEKLKCLLCGMKSFVSFSFLPDLALSLWSCPDRWRESVACIVDEDMYCSCYILVYKMLGVHTLLKLTMVVLIVAV